MHLLWKWDSRILFRKIVCGMQILKLDVIKPLGLAIGPKKPNIHAFVRQIL